MDDFEDGLASFILHQHSQFAFKSSGLCSSSDVWYDTRILPGCACLLSLLALLLLPLYRFIRHRMSTQRHPEAPHDEHPLPDPPQSSGTDGAAVEYLGKFAGRRGGVAVVALNVLRLVGLVALAALSVFATWLSKQQVGDGDWSVLGLSCSTVMELILAVTYAYAIPMAFLTIALTGEARRTCNVHVVSVLFVQFAVFAWRNFLPSVVVGGVPADAGVQWLLWSRGCLITAVGFVIPLVIPTEYRPVNPSDNRSRPSPEQTASILSFILFVFLEPVIYAAYRVPRLPYERLPPLPDTDWSSNLVHFVDAMDPVERRANGLKEQRLFQGLMRAFGWDYATLVLVIVVQVCGGFVGPVGINRILHYLEVGGRDEGVRPWAWILLLFLGRMLVSIFFNIYVFVTTRMVVRCETMLTQLIFRQAVRMRVSDEDILLPNEPPSSNGINSKTRRGTSGFSPSSEPHGPDTKATTKQLAGRINNLIGTDINQIVHGVDWMFLVVGLPLEVVIAVWFLFRILDWAAILGTVIIMVTLPIPTLISTRWIDGVQKAQMKRTDERVQTITESLNVIRMIKMFGWETMVKKVIGERRDAELDLIKRRKVLTVVLYVTTSIIPLVNMLSVFAFYTLVLKKQLDAATLFSSIPVFDTLKSNLRLATDILFQTIQAKVSLDRVNDFVSETNVLDKFQSPQDLSPTAVASPDTIGFHNASFRWSTNTAISPGRDFRLLLDDLIFKQGEINVITGPTGCGKTSILMALLGEMHFEAVGAEAWYHLPRQRGVAYAAQETWVTNDTIKGNILFGNTYDPKRYEKVVWQCGLKPDLELFAAGDETEVGERGITLSGGQKARVTLARAIYSRAEILLLDDVLAALDVHTARWVVRECLQGELVSGRTVLLVTHAVALFSAVAGNIVALDSRGNVISQGAPLLKLSPSTLAASQADEVELSAGAVTDLADPSADSQDVKGDSKLVLTEEIGIGRLPWGAVKLLSDAFGGLKFWSMILSGYGVMIVADILGTWWLGVWADAYETMQTVPVSYYLSISVLIELGVRTTTFTISYLAYTYRSIYACRRVHDALCDTVFGATRRWLDVTPVGRVISRFTQDITEVDGPLSSNIPVFIGTTFALVADFLVIVIMYPAFIVPALVITVLGIFLGQVYLAAQMQVKRIRSNWKSPVYNHLGAVINGLVSVRAYGVEGTFQAELCKRLDEYARPSRTFFNLNRWAGTRADLLAASFFSGLAAYLVYARSGTRPGGAGFSLNIAISFSTIILSWIKLANALEVSANSLERIRDYLVIEQEPRATEKGRPPAYWPSSGSIRAVDLCARYSPDGPQVLHTINFHIKSGERIGIVGRTGSGKSSLALSLLRLIPTSGSVYIDDLPTHEINLDSLRGSIAIIPQEPTLISGTLRSNLDPLSEQSDAALNDALRAVGLIGGSSEAAIEMNLDFSVSHGGANFSVGQRQLIALARAIVRRTKVLILDEATASVDMKTDAVIQQSIREELQHATLLTIAHRLQTIMDYDRIMVLDSGKLVEFDSPISLLLKETSLFRALVEESGQREELWELAQQGRGPQ